MNGNSVKPIESKLSETLRATRLGTCYNAITRELIVRQNAFDLAKLNGAQRIMLVTGHGQFELQADSGNNAEQNSTAWGASGSASGGIFGCKVAASFSMENAHAHSRSSSEIKAYISYRYLDYHLAIQNAEEEIYFNCLLPDCRSALEAVLKCPDTQERFKRYMNFRTRFGTGCVTKLYLGAGSIAKISIDTEEHASSSRSKYEGTASVSTLFSNVKTAAGWAKKHQEAGLKGSVSIEATDYPATSPTKEWVHQLVNLFAEKGIDEIAKPAGWASLPEVDFAPQNPVTEEDSPDQDTLPKKMNDDKELTDEWRETIMKEENFSGTWDEFVDKQHQLMEEIDKSKIVKEAIDLPSDSAKLARVKANLQSAQDTYASTKYQAVRESPLAESGSTWDLGGFQPVDFEITDWEALFPSLSQVLRPPSTSNIYFAKLMTFYYTRLQFGEYLQFLQEVYDALSQEGKKTYENRFLKNDIPVYFGYCESYLRQYFNSAKNHLSEADYLYWVSKFETGLLADDLEFFNKKIYSLFFENYDLLSQCPYGFICHGIRQGAANSENSWEVDKYLKLEPEQLTSRHTHKMRQSAYFGLIGELPQAIRLYPAILSKKNENLSQSDFKLLYFYEGEARAPSGGYLFHDQGNNIYFEIGQNDQPGKTKSAQVQISNQQFASTRVLVQTTAPGKPTTKHIQEDLPLLRCVGFDSFPEDVALRGSTPMFRNFPFDQVKNFPR